MRGGAGGISVSMRIFRSFEHVLLPAAIIGVVAMAQLPRERLALELEAPREHASRLSFHGAQTIQQTLTLPLRDIGRIDIPINVPERADAYPLILHVRSSPKDKRDLRTLYVTRRDVSETDDVIVFRFLPETRGKEQREISLALDAPNARPNEFFAYREVDAAKYPDGHLSAGERNVAGNIALRVYVRRPWYRLLASDAARALTESLEEPGDVFAKQVSSTALVLRILPTLDRIVATVAAVIAAFGILTVPRVRQWILQRTTLSRGEIAFFAALAIVSLILHLPYMYAYPAVNDEGSYLMDIAQFENGRLPFRDFLTKGPLFLVLLSPAVLSHGPSLIAARVLIAFAAAIEVVLISLLARALWGRAAGIAAAILSAAMPAVVSQSTHVFLQPMELVFVTLTLLTILSARDPIIPPSRRNRKLCAAGAVLALSSLTRASAIAFFVPAFVLLLMQEPRSWRQAARRLTVFLAGFAAVVGSVAVLSLLAMGPEKTAILLNLEAVLVSQGRVESGHAAGIFGALSTPRDTLHGLIAAGASILRTGFPLLLLWLLIVSRALFRLLRLPRAAFPLIVGLILLFAWPSFRDVFHISPDVTPPVRWLLTASVPLLTLFGLDAMTRMKDVRLQPLRDALLLGGTWVALTVMYASLGRFRQHYHPEFLFLYVLASALFLSELLHVPVVETLSNTSTSLAARIRNIFTWKCGNFPAAGIVAVTIAWIILGHDVAIAMPHVGTFPISIVHEAARSLRLHTAPGEEVLTAQPILTFLAERRIPFDASHPGWYLEEQAGTISSSLRRIYFPEREALREYVESTPIRTIVLDRRTEEVYITPDPLLRVILERSFHVIDSFEVPGQQPIELWQRKEK